MKSTTAYRAVFAKRNAPLYPNAATQQELFQKFIDLLLMGAIGISAATIVLFLIALG